MTNLSLIQIQNSIMKLLIRLTDHEVKLYCADVLFLIKKRSCCWEGIVFQILQQNYLEVEVNLVICYLKDALLLFSRAMLEATSSPVVFCHNDCQEGKLLIFQYCSVMYC